MANQFIGVPIDAPGGKKVDTSELAVGANTVERQRMVVADDATAAALAAVTNAAPGAVYGLVTRNIPSPGVPQDVNLIQIAGTAVLAGNGVTGLGSQRVTVASDNTPFPVKVDQTTPGTTNAISVAQIGATTVLTGNGVTGAGSQRITIASDNTAFKVIPNDGTNSVAVTTASAAIAENTSTFMKVDAANYALDTAAVAGSQQVPLRVVSTAIPNLKTDASSWAGSALGAPTNFGTTPGAVVAAGVNASVFLGTVAAVAGNGVTGTGSQRITIASDNSAVSGLGAGATGAAPPANAVFLGGRAATANPSNATGGNLVGVMTDKAGRLCVVNNHIRDLVGVQQTNIASSSETTIVTAGAAGVFNDISAILITTAGAAAQTITIKDATAGTTRMVINYPNAALAPGSAFVMNFDPPLPQAVAANNWTATQSAATACNYTIVFVKNT